MFSKIMSIRNQLEELQDTVMEVLHPGEDEWEDFSTINFQDKQYWPSQYLLHGHPDWPGAKFRVRSINELRQTVYVTVR